MLAWDADDFSIPPQALLSNSISVLAGLRAWKSCSESVAWPVNSAINLPATFKDIWRGAAGMVRRSLAPNCGPRLREALSNGSQGGEALSVNSVMNSRLGVALPRKPPTCKTCQV